MPYDIPFDSPIDRPSPDDGAVFQKDGTYVNYRVVYLQRLANPLLPYDNTPTRPAKYNPYRTIDQMAIDVTAFNGISTDSDLQAGRGAGHALRGPPARHGE